MSGSQALFNATYPSAKTLREILRAVAEFNKKPPVRISASEVAVRTMDASHVCMIDLTIPSTAFTEYSSTNDPTVALDLENLLKRFPKPITPTPVKLLIDKKVRLHFKGRILKQLTVPTLEDWAKEEYATVPIPKLDLTARVVLPAYDFSNALDDLSRENDCLTFKNMRDGEGLHFGIGSANEDAEEQVEFEYAEDVNVTAIEGEVKATFSVPYIWKNASRYIMSIHKAAKTVKPYVRLEWARNFPLKITTELADKTRLTWYFAPRIDTDEKA